MIPAPRVAQIGNEMGMPEQSPYPLRLVVFGLLAIHALMLVRITMLWSPNPDETAHLPAGVRMWNDGRFDLYRVNPPLTRLVAAFPVSLQNPHMEMVPESSRVRREFRIGDEFFCNNGDRSIWFYRQARWACLPFSLLGGYVCFRWARELYGNAPGLVALVLWCFSPNVLCWSATICPDGPAAAMGITAGYCFWKWMKTPDWWTASVASLTLGLCELTKTTWIVLYVVWPLVWLFFHCLGRQPTPLRNWFREAMQIAWLMGLSLLVLNVGYAFEEPGKKLGDFSFVSQTLTGEAEGQSGNRFAGTWLGEVPVPLPTNYVLGIDEQKHSFEQGLKSYLCGQWSSHGWWYYYLVCLALKVPLGTLALATIAGALGVFRLARTSFCHGHEDEKPRDELTDARNCFPLLLPAIVVFLVVSSQTGFGRHSRYILPAAPFMFVWMSGVFHVRFLRQRWIATVATLALVSSIASSLWIYPHCMAYFNELAGGPQNGHRYLLDSNIDWQQNLLLLSQWQEEHPKARPMYTLWYGQLPPEPLGIESAGVPVKVPGVPTHGFSTPCWQAISIHCLHEFEDQFGYVRNSKPAAVLGYSIYIYRITDKTAFNEFFTPERTPDHED
jgi:dolichyl-phosphate-mannose-protein mannosyltransferase